MRQCVLVPIDFKPGCEAVLAWAVELVQRTGGTLEVLHVVPPVHQLDPFFRPGLVPHRTLGQIRELAAAELARLLRARRVSYRLHVTEGEPAATILEQAERLGPGLIVIGTRGRGGVARLLLGSVAEKVIQGATVPVVTIPPSR